MWFLLIGCVDPKEPGSEPDGSTDSGGSTSPDGPTWYADADGDGFGDPAVSRDAVQQPAGFVDNADDCDDARADVYPGAVEVCDGVDQDCGGEIDEGVQATSYADVDEDGYGDPAAPAQVCPGTAGYASDASDCDDGDPDISPGADEICDGIDDDCDEEVDERLLIGWWPDADEDGYGADVAEQYACTLPAGAVPQTGDCDDGDPGISPDVSEVCDGIDNDCDEGVDEGLLIGWWPDVDEDGYGAEVAEQYACALPAGAVPQTGDCDDSDPTAHLGGTEVCDGADDDCDGVDDDGANGFVDGDGDGYGGASATCDDTDTLPGGGDCDDADPAVHPGGPELCDGLDDDCDPSTTEPVLLGSIEYPTIALALGAAVDGDVVEICDGTWTEHGLAVTANVTVASHSGNRDAVVLDGEDVEPVFRVDGGALTLRSVTVQHGSGDTSSGVPTGGGVNALGGAGGPVTVDDCRFVENVAHRGSKGIGGAIAGAAIAVTGSDFDANDAVLGGAVYVDGGGSLTISGSTFEANTADQGGALGAPASGAAMAIAGSVFDANVARSFGGAISRGYPLSLGVDPLTLTGCTFTANEGWRGGGAILDLEYETMTITGCTFEGNVASPPGSSSPYAGGYGGAIEAGSAMSISHSAFRDNGTGVEWCGGAISAEVGAVDLVDTTFDGNAALGGGAVCAASKVTADATTTFTGNQAINKGSSLALGGAVNAFLVVGGTYIGNHSDGFGGAIASSGSISGVVVQGNDAAWNGGGLYVSNAVVEDSIVTDNTAGIVGGGVYVWSYGGSSATLTRVTVDGNQAPDGGGLAIESGSSVAIADSTLVSNLADPGDGGAVYLIRTATLSVTDSDLGSGGTDNGPDDVYQETGATSYAYGADASFDCDAAGCG